jgi:hypothetical protein
MTIDRAKLEEAIKHVRGLAAARSPIRSGGPGYIDGYTALPEHLDTAAAAAEAHMATLPKTKMVEVWHVEYFDLDDALPRVGVWMDKASAEARVAKMRREASSCIRVTGPHQQCVPA